MSRWIEKFKNHDFQNSWKKLKQEAESLEASDVTIATSIQEVARFKKVITFLDELIESTDAELVPLNTWDQFNEQISLCRAQVNSYTQNKDIGHINNANGNLDNLLSYLKPYVVNFKGSAVAAGKAYNSYSDAINNHLKLIEEKVKSVLKEVQDSKSKTENIVSEVETSKINIKTLESEFLTGEGENLSLKQKMESLFSDATAWHSKLKEYHQKLTSGNEQESSIILQIENAKKKAVQDSSETASAKDSVGALLKDLGKFYVTIFGTENSNGEREGGLKQELDVRTKELEDFKQIHQETYKTLHEEIEGLIPGAVSAGLASAYKELKDSFDVSIALYSKIFYFSLLGIFLAGSMLIIKDIGFWHITLIDLTNPIHLVSNLIYKLPILVPALWLAIFASKRRSEDRRLQQEYAHKEALAKSYQSFKMQIESLNKPDDALMKQLLEKAITAIAFNASATLDGKHGDKIPFIGALETIAEKLTEKGILDFNPLNKK